MRRVLSAITILFFSLGLLAQESTVKGNLRGTVFDSSGAVVTRAKVTLTGPTGSRSTMSDSEGRFVFDLLTPGVYSVTAEQSGFKATKINQVEVYANRVSAIPLTLESVGPIDPASPEVPARGRGMPGDRA